MFNVYFIEDNADLHESIMRCIESHDVLWPRCNFRRFADSVEALRSSAPPPDVVLIDAGSIGTQMGHYSQYAERVIEKLADQWASATYLIYSALGDVVRLDWIVDDFKRLAADARCIGTCQDIEASLMYTLGIEE